MNTSSQLNVLFLRLFRAGLIAFAIQVPFVILMRNVGLHSALGGVWYIFYLPAFMIVGAIGLDMTSEVSTIIKGVIVQEILLTLLILLLMHVYNRSRPPAKVSVD
jgi:hypothetical protein